MTGNEISELPLKFLFSVPPALVLIFRPAWADKLVGRLIRITPARGKLFGGLVLLGFVFDLGWTVLMGYTPGPQWWLIKNGCEWMNISDPTSCYVWGSALGMFFAAVVLLSLVVFIFAMGL